MAGILGILKGQGAGLQLLRSLLNDKVPAVEALAHVKSAGYNLIPQTAEQFAEYLKTVVVPANTALEQLHPSVLPNIASLPLTLTKSLRNFSYLVKLTGQSMLGGQLEDKYISISTNSLLTKEQAVDAAVSIASFGTKSGGLTNADGEVTSISQNSAGLTERDTILPGPAYPFSNNNEGKIQAYKDNRDYLKTVASGPVSPVVFTQPTPYVPFGYDSLDDYYRDVS
jgi:hypothetical protein